MDVLTAEFLIETKERLTSIESGLINLTDNPADKEILNTLYRLIHTIKGTAALLGFVRLGKLTSAGEDVIDQIRLDEFATTESVGAFKEVVGRIKSLLIYLEENGTEEEGNDCAFIAKVKSHITGIKPEETPLTVREIIQQVQEALPEIPQSGEYEEGAVSSWPQTETAIKPDVDFASTDTEITQISIGTFEELLNQAGELVLTRNKILNFYQGDVASPVLQDLINISSRLYEGLSRVGKLAIAEAFAKLPDIVSFRSGQLGKQVQFTMQGGEISLSNQLLSAIGSPIIDMITNCIEYSIEVPHVRKQVGKPEISSISIGAYHAGGYILIEICNDGKGVDPQELTKIILEKGLVPKSNVGNLDMKQLLEFIFAPALSNNNKMATMTGFGSSMFMVKDYIEKIGGSAALESEQGIGSKFIIKLPLSMSIMRVLVFKVQEQQFAVAQANVMEIVRVGGGDARLPVEYVDDSGKLHLRGKTLPLVDIASILGIGLEGEDRGNFVIICELCGYSFGIIVDKVQETEEVFVRPVSPLLQSISIYSGNAFLADDRILLILDLKTIAQSIGCPAYTTKSVAINETKSDNTGSQVAGLVIFKAGGDIMKALPLPVLVRLEEVDVDKIEHNSAVPVVEFQGKTIQLVIIDPEYQLPVEGMQMLLVVNQAGLYAGLVVEKVIDIIRTPVTYDVSSIKEGVLGKVIIGGEGCDILDVAYYFNDVSTDCQEKKQIVNDALKDILLVDDSPFFRKFIPPGLESEGFTVTTASGAREALFELDRGRSYLAIVTDMVMPGMDGYELASLCRQKPHLKNVPIIVLTSDKDDPGIFENVEKNHIDAFVSKTNHFELVATIKSLIKAKKEYAVSH